ncbi:DNA translocase FtsK [Gemmiger sp.]
MAQSRSGKKSTKSSGTKKRTSSSKSSSSRSTSARSASSRSSRPSGRAKRRAETPNLARSVLLVGLSLLCVALVLVPGQNLWRTLRSWYFGVFGVMTYFVGPFLLYLAYLLASGYRVALFAGKVSLMGVLCAGVPVIFSKLNVEGLKAGEVIKMLFTRGGTYYWEGGVLGAPVGATLLALFGRPASNILMLLVFLLGLMFFFAITPVDVVLFVDTQYKKLQAKREERAAAETAYDTRLFHEEPEEESVENLTEALPDANRPHHPVYDVIADTSRFPKQAAAPVQQPARQYAQPYTAPVTPVVPEAPFTQQPAPQSRAGFDVDLGPDATEAARVKAETHDPLEPVNIGPGGTFGMDPLSGKTNSPLHYARPQQAAPAPAPQEDFELQLEPAEEEPAYTAPYTAPASYTAPSTSYTAAPADSAPAPQEPVDELDALINRAVSGHAPYYAPQEVSAETTLDLPQPTEFETPLTPVPQEPQFDTPLVPVEPEEDLPEPTPVELPQIDMTGRVQGDTMVISPADLAAGMAAQNVAPLGEPTAADASTTPAAAPMPAAPVSPAVPASPAAIPTLGGSFSDTGSVVSAAWQSGRSVSEMLDAMASQPAAPSAPAVPVQAPAYTAPAAEPVQEETTPAQTPAYTAPTTPQPAPSAPAYQPAPQPMTRPAAETTQSSFTVPQQGEAARVRVSTAVGNSAGAPIHTPPVAAKADPNAMRLPTSEEQPPEPYCYPSLNLFNPTRPDDEAGAAREMKKNADILVNTLDSFGVKTTMLDICRGPSVTRYELQPQAGIKVSRITSLADDIALNLATAGVRIEAPIPGKPAVGIEVPNKIRSTVNIRSVFESQNYINMRSPLTMALGKDIAGTAQVADLCKMPHLLIAGSTGSGKSVCVNSIIISFLFRSGPEDVKLILIDPKVVELAEYNGIPHLLMPVVTEPRKAAGALGASVAEMERRYKLFAENNVREIKAYNKLAAQTGMEHLPYIAIVIDELADLMMVAGKEVEDYICRIAQKARAAGIHLIVATQRPSVDVITGLIKANIPSRIAFAVSSQIDSRTILDSGGAEKLLGNGDMLFLPVGASKPVRVQGTFVTDEEIGAVLSFIKSTSTAQYDEEMIAEMERRAVAEKGSKKGGDDDGDAGGALDAMFEQAVECVIEAGQASTSLLQRRCKLGYARAARIMDQMEQEKIIGPYEGAKPRAVLVTKSEWEERKLNGRYDE